jgi:hypothetical protein
MKKKIIILLIILAAIAGGFFYFWYVWLPAQIEKEQSQTSTTTPPTLFGKEDYKIEERTDGKYIVVPKVGLTAKVPEGWKVEKVKSSGYPESEYWINLYSPDAKVFDILTEGCGISIMVGTAKETVDEVRNNIKVIKKNPNINPEEISYIYKGYTLEIVRISNYQGLRWKAPERPKMGQALGLDIPIDKDKLISFDTLFPPGFKEKCAPIWKEFLENVEIK